MRIKFDVKQTDQDTIEYLRREFNIVEEEPSNGFDGVAILAIIVAVVGIIPTEKIIELALRPSVTVHISYPDGRYIEVSGTNVKKIKKQVEAVQAAFVAEIKGGGND